jgi:hypothetical protein
VHGQFARRSKQRQISSHGHVKRRSAAAAVALAKPRQYQDAADADGTPSAYKADLADFKAWCIKDGLRQCRPTPEIVGAFLAAAGEGINAKLDYT